MKSALDGVSQDVIDAANAAGREVYAKARAEGKTWRKASDAATTAYKRVLRTDATFRKNRVEQQRPKSIAQLEVLRNLKERIGCEVCAVEGVHNTTNLHFHHVTPSEKRFHVSSVVFGRPIDDVLDEIDKCVVLCRKHHSEIHRLYREQKQSWQADRVIDQQNRRLD